MLPEAVAKVLATVLHMFDPDTSAMKMKRLWWEYLKGSEEVFEIMNTPYKQDNGYISRGQRMLLFIVRKFYILTNLWCKY